MRKTFLATASAVALALSASAFAQSNGTDDTTVLPAPRVGNDQAGQTSSSGSSVRNGVNTGPADENQVGATNEDTQPGGSVGVTPDISNSRGQTQASGSSKLNSTTGEITDNEQQGGSVGVNPDISNDRGQTQASGSSKLNSTTGARLGCQTTSTQANQAENQADASSNC